MIFSKIKPYVAKGLLAISSFCVGTHYGPEIQDLYQQTKDSVFEEQPHIDPRYENAKLLVRYVYETKK